jgi:hypothetical protein
MKVENHDTEIKYLNYLGRKLENKIKNDFYNYRLYHIFIKQA